MTDQALNPKALSQFEGFFEIFLEDLKEANTGKMAQEHCTAYPLFVVKKKHLIIGIDRQYTDLLCGVTEDGHVYTDPKQVFQLLTDTKPEDVFADRKYPELHTEIAEELEALGIQRFSEASTLNQWDILQAHPTFALTVTGYHESWEFDSAHLTSASAEHKKERLAIRLGSHKVKVDVESGWDSHEHVQLVSALLKGYLAPVKL